MRSLADAGAAGPFFFEGRGAGAGPTASAVIADLVDVARGAFGPAFGRPASRACTARAARRRKRGVSAYYLRFQVLDVPGVMAEISRHLANEQRFHRKHDPARPRARRAGRHRHDHPRNAAMRPCCAP